MLKVGKLRRLLGHSEGKYVFIDLNNELVTLNDGCVSEKKIKMIDSHAGFLFPCYPEYCEDTLENNCDYTIVETVNAKVITI